MEKQKYWFWLEIILLTGILFAFRLYVTFPVENSGDSFVKWFEAKRLAHGLDYSRLDHHTMRWAINFLSLSFQKVFGTEPSTYYLPSAFAATFSGLFLFLIGIRLKSHLLGITVLLLFSLHPAIIYAGCQLFPGIFSCCYMLGAIYFLLLYSDDAKGTCRYLVVSSIFFFCAYGAKMTNLFFLPAILFYLYWSSGNLRPVIFYFGIFVVGFLTESLIIDALLGDFTMFGRISLAGGHLNIMKSGLEGEKSLWGIITRWQMLPNYTYLHIMAGFFSAFYIINNPRRHTGDFLIALCFLSFAFFLSFGLSSIEPVRFFLPHMPRYINICIPFSLLLCLSLAGKLKEKKYIIVAFALIFLPYSVSLAGIISSPEHRQFYKIDKYQKRVESFLEQGYGFVFLYPKNARLYRAMFVPDKAAMGIDNADDELNIYVVPAGATPYNPGRRMYLLTLKKDTITAGLVRPYPHEYRLAVERFTPGVLPIRSGWGLVW